MKWIFIVSLFCAFNAKADENILPASKLLAMGYREWKPAHLLNQPQILAHTLPWPVRFQDASHQIGNAMAQFQPFGGVPYFHGGCDLRVEAGADVLAPVGGKLEAGHYGYDTNADGSLKKYWMPWPEEGNPTYFEVAVVAENGIRYEFHHMDRDTLPDSIVNKLNAGGGTVEAGTLLGHVIEWPGGEYHHTHYNVILPDETRVNPEFVSTLLPDTLAPNILASYAVMPDKSVVDFGQGLFRSAPTEIVISVVDKMNNNVYEHAPVFASLKFASGEESTWDFREKLIGADGKFPNLFSFFKDSLTTPNGRRIYTEGGYGMGKSLVRIKVPNGHGVFSIQIGDMAGNISTLSGVIQ